MNHITLVYIELKNLEKVQLFRNSRERDGQAVVGEKNGTLLRYGLWSRGI